MPSVDEAAVVEPFAIAAYRPPPNATSTQTADAGMVRVAQVMPSVDEAADVVDVATATKPLSP